MHTREEKIHIDGHKVFTRLVIKKTTSWTLGELLDALPADIEINDEYHRDDYTEQHALDRHSVVAIRSEYFDGRTGQRLKKVQQKREVTTIAWEDAYEPDDSDGICEGAAGANDPAGPRAD